LQQHVFTIAKVCQHYGIENAVICPGSRSAPLVFAFTSITGMKCYSVIDERSAAFMALGMAQQLQKPVVLICTSGTACLNFFPAVAEAFYQKIPLLILTADRPPEMLNQQDGQMIMQKGVFGKHVLGSYELLSYQEENVDFKLTEKIILNAIEESVQESGFGPVHINVPLREPLYNFPEIPSFPELHFRLEKKISTITELPLLNDFSDAWKASKKKLILVGQMPPDSKLSNFLNTFINHDDVVLLADIASNQHEISNAGLFDFGLQHVSKEQRKDLAPDFILSIGGPIVSKSMKIWLKGIKPNYHFRIQAQAESIDTYQNLTQLLEAELLLYLDAFVSLKGTGEPSKKEYSLLWKLLNNKADETLKAFHENKIWCEPNVVNKILAAIPENSQLQLGNSASVRWVSWLGAPLKALQIFSNRGTSGIDGTVSTAIGAARVQADKIVTLICGDLSLFYDQNAFWQNNLPSNLKIIILNNHSGNIFNWIEGPKNHPDTLSYFTTPHHLSVKKLADQFGLNYFESKEWGTLQEGMDWLYAPQPNISILELSFEEVENMKGINAFKELVIG
jgi:2-succinyl-5-enolpyruvyl-6-hydroxy-3-cyclohexene-1-carboxylate synthase